VLIAWRLEGSNLRDRVSEPTRRPSANVPSPNRVEYVFSHASMRNNLIEAADLTTRIEYSWASHASTARPAVARTLVARRDITREDALMSAAVGSFS
jgi:hypothetical protein